MSEPKEYTEEEKREIKEQIREFHPEYNGVLDQMGEIREKLQVVDKRRFNGPVGPDDGSDLPRAGDGEGSWEMIARGDVSPSDPIFPNPALELLPRQGGDLTTGFSPSANPDKPSGMDFAAALQQVLEGRRITRLEWGNPDIWLMMFMWTNINPKTPAGKYLTIHHADGAMHPLYINDGDLTGNDWVVVV